MTNGVQAIRVADTMKPLSLSTVAGAGVLTGLWMIQAGWKVVLAAPLVLVVAGLAALILVLPVLAMWPITRQPGYFLAAAWGTVTAWMAAALTFQTIYGLARGEVLLGFGLPGATAGLLYSYLVRREPSR
jgi:hypothetical protein